MIKKRKTLARKKSGVGRIGAGELLDVRELNRQTGESCLHAIKGKGEPSECGPSQRHKTMCLFVSNRLIIIQRPVYFFQPGQQDLNIGFWFDPVWADKVALTTERAVEDPCAVGDYLTI
ncbi:MAG: hypothetical protein HQ561_18940 [Desulfobacteraceae bacterium]|nr:hypothetical protein [Desulfobacteraceae bacterium]